VSDDSNIEHDVIEKLASLQLGKSDVPNLKLKLSVAKSDNALLSKLKELHSKVLKVDGNEVFVVAPARRLEDIAHLKEVIRIGLVK
jgi:hypothetical protein